MNYNFILALFAKYTTMTKDEAEELAKILTNSIQPHRYDDAERFIGETVKKLKIK